MRRPRRGVGRCVSRTAEQELEVDCRRFQEATRGRVQDLLRYRYNNEVLVLR
jgi:hypothetical protein